MAKVTRRQAREWAIQMLTSADLNPPENVDKMIEDFWEELLYLDEYKGGIPGPRECREFAEGRVRGVLEKLNEIDEILVPLLANWHLYRLGTVERSVLRMGVWELTWSDVPHPVVINEAIDLANWFSSPKSRRIINGVLDKYSKQVEKAQAESAK